MSEGLVIFEEFDGYAVITFNRPEKRNALSSPMVGEIQEAIEVCRGKHRVVIFTARGDTFCAGVDLRERNDWVRKGAKIRGDSVRNKWYDTIGSTIRNHPSIFIAAVNGLCLGAGVTLVNICDLAVMSEDAQIAIPQISFNIYPGVAGASSQTRILRKHATELILNGDRIGAERAVEMGMVNKAVPPERLMEEATELAKHVAAFDPIALDWCKKALDQIPSQISDWNLALNYGRTVTNIIQNQIGRDKVSPEGFVAAKPS